ncbi:TRAP-type C4-dicarboxylate transport system, small permease component [Litoreibacter arenae DSM 19593]|uniref:TRAP transporter small permease protein n=2 Tax=Litoreibacter TaxID=947567 RepID=S9QKN6_9RHOB|nr:TRAP-type C4-dicarboxylate transport system, small permease component [Litoreibacter arenae DSM 19593]
MMNEDQDKIDFSEYENVGDELLADAGGAVGKKLPDDMHPLARKAIYAIDHFSNWQGRIACLLVVPIILAMVYEVIARKFFIAPTLWSYDLSRMLYGMSFMLGAAYALMRGLHIRADFIYRGFSDRTQGRVDLILYVVLFMPAMLFFLKAGYDFSAKSFLQGERAGDSTWAPIVWPVKMALTAGVFFLCIQGISEILKSWYAATRGKWPV